MTPGPKPADYYAGCNPALLRAVPESARHILDVGCGEGRLGAALKRLRPDRVVYGVEREPAAAARAAAVLDRVFARDVADDPPPLEALDCLIFGDVLEHLADPEAALRRYRDLLAPDGQALCSIPNLQHHSLLAALLTGDFQYAPAGLLDATHLRFFTAATMLKLLLDAGFVPEVVEAVATGCPPGLLAAARPLIEHLGLHPGRTAAYLGAYQYILRGRPLNGPPADPGAEPLTVVACVTDEAQLRANLLASPDLAAGSPHELLLYRGCPSAAAALNRALDRARHGPVVWAHQDVYLPRGWAARLAAEYRRAEHALGPIGVAGVYGVARQGGRFVRVGRVVDRDRLLDEPAPLPARAEAPDELLLALPRGTPLRADPALGFHFYGADLGLQATARGLAAAILDAPCLHNSRSVGLPPAFWTSAAAFRAKWADRLPVATSCVLIGRDGAAREFGAGAAAGD